MLRQATALNDIPCWEAVVGQEDAQHFDSGQMLPNALDVDLVSLLYAAAAWQNCRCRIGGCSESGRLLGS